MRWLIWVILFAASAEAAPLDEEKLKVFLRHDCGSCHGLQLKGGLGPSLEPTRMRGRAWQEIQAVILEGRPGTAMPPWKSLLSKEEAEWLARYLVEEKK